MTDLVTRLENKQRIVAVCRPEQTEEEFRAAIERGYVHVKFVETDTELGIDLGDGAPLPERCTLDEDARRVSLNGELNLDYVDVRFVGEVSLDSLEGQGQLERLTAKG